MSASAWKVLRHGDATGTVRGLVERGPGAVANTCRAGCGPSRLARAYEERPPPIRPPSLAAPPTSAAPRARSATTPAPRASAQPRSRAGLGQGVARAARG